MLQLPSCLHSWVFAKEIRHIGEEGYHPWLILIGNGVTPEEFTLHTCPTLSAPVFVR